MAKRATKNQQVTAPLQDAIIDWAEDLGRLLGTAETKAKGWIDQRKAVAQQLEGIRDTASRLLTQLTGSEVASLARIPRRGRAAAGKDEGLAAGGEASGGVTPKRRGGMSPEGRARVAAAQKARWAKLRAEAVKKGAQVRAGVKKKKAAQ